MKYQSVVFALLLSALTARAALPQPDLLAQIHFAGAQKISADPHSQAFTNEFCSAEALALRAQTAAKLAGWLAGWLRTNSNATVADGPAKLRPLFDDLQTSEWFLEARTAAGGKPEVAVAIRLDPARAQLWQASLIAFLPSASFKNTGGWLIFDSNPALLNLGNRLAQELAVPPAGWLDLDINWPLLAQWHPLLKELALPETHFSLTAPDNNFRVNGKFFFAQNLALNLEPWRVPTNTIRQPFDSFTAARGFAAWLPAQTWTQPFQITPTPNQLFAWSLPSFPFQTYAAVPVPDSARALSQINAELEPSVATADALQRFIAPVKPELTNNEIVFGGMPFVALKLRALSEPAGQFLMLELFPNSARSRPLQTQIFSALAVNNLVYYHWELTAVRMSQLLQISQYALMFTRHKQLDAMSAGFRWLQRIGPTLGNNDTEIVQSGPAEFTFTRKSPGIFTAPELYTLANWLEATNFPGFNLNLPPHPMRPLLKPQPQFRLITPQALPGPAPGH
jgi:hypothetical protein